MPGLLNVHAIRRLAVAKFFAALLVVLAISPFTAPFATFDIAEIVGDKPFHSSDSALKLVQDLADLSFTTVHVLPPDTSASVILGLCLERTLARPILALVLRI